MLLVSVNVHLVLASCYLYILACWQNYYRKQWLLALYGTLIFMLCRSNNYVTKLPNLEVRGEKHA